MSAIEHRRPTAFASLVAWACVAGAAASCTASTEGVGNDMATETQQQLDQAQLATARRVGDTMLHPPAQPFPKTPEAYAIDYRDVEFETRDGVRLSGWLLNEDADKIVVMTHFGYRANRYGYQLAHQPEGSVPYDKEIEFIRVAKRLTDAGYAVLMYDLRNHGESGKSSLGVGTGGVDERWDVLAAVDFVASLSGASTSERRPVGLLSYCMGANSTMTAMAEDPGAFSRANVKAMVALQPLTNGDYLRSIGIDGALLDAVERHFTAHTGGISLDAPIQDAARAVRVPTRLVQARKDPNTSFEFVAAVYDNIPAEKEMYWLEEPTHRFDGYNWFADHPEDMLTWFDRYVIAAP